MVKRYLVLLISAMSLASAHAAEQAMTPLTPDKPVAPACLLVDVHEIESYIGTPATVRESRGSGSEAGLCSWVGTNGEATINLMLFPGASHGIPEGTERDYFDRMIEGEKRQHQPGEFVAVPELADDAWAFDPSDNPTQYFAVYLFKGKDNVTVTTNGIGLEATVAIARQAASRM